MTELPVISAKGAAAIGPGRLVLVVGPSGAGKDTLLRHVQAACAGDDSIVFPRRVVTREASVSEDNVSVSRDEFQQARDRGEFAVHWDAHGHCYALPAAIDDDIRAGKTVVANVSRTVVNALRCAYANVLVVLITAPPEVLTERLTARARRSDGNVADRLRRSVDDAETDVTILNAGSAEYHSRQLLRIVGDERWCV